MKFSPDSGIDMSETEIEPGLVIKRKLILTDVSVERDIERFADTPKGSEFKSTKIQSTNTGDQK